MKENIVLTNYKCLSQEELKNLPIDELARIAHEALKNWDKLNQILNQDSTNSSRAPSTDSPEAKAKRKAEEKAEHQKRGTRKQGAQPWHSIKTTARINEVNSVKFLRELIRSSRSKVPAPSIFSTSSL